MSGQNRAPFLLDTSVLREIARGDPDLIRLIQRFDANKQPMVVPALAVTGASLDVRSEDADDLLGGLDLFEEVTVAPLNGPDQATALAEMISNTGLDPWDAHVAAIADASVLAILTLDQAKWQEPSRALDG